MNKLGLRFNFVKIVFLTLAFCLIASAQATRTWVSGVGDDANPCSRTAPCKTFAGAISKTTAGGEINCLDPGGFGALTITKAITLDCNQVFGSVLVGGTNGIVVSAGPSDVVKILNLGIDGTGTGINGINFLSGRILHVENVSVYNFTNTCINAATTALSSLTIQNVSLSECGTAGIQLANTSGGLVTEIAAARISNNAAGLKGLGGAIAHVRNSFFSFNTVGVSQNAAGSVISVSSSQFDGDGVGVQSLGGAAIHIIGNTFGSNSTAVNTNGGSIFSDGQNGMVANGANGTVTGPTTKL